MNKDPNLQLVSRLTLLEHQIFNRIDNIDQTKPWDSERNQLRYMELFQTITEIRKLHPNWGIELEELGNIHSCRCRDCTKTRYSHWENRIEKKEYTSKDDKEKEETPRQQRRQMSEISCNCDCFNNRKGKFFHFCSY